MKEQRAQLPAYQARESLLSMFRGASGHNNQRCHWLWQEHSGSSASFGGSASGRSQKAASSLHNSAPLPQLWQSEYRLNLARRVLEAFVAIVFAERAR